ncbi:MAG: hypothetical protein WCI77_05130 [Candidatus Omnitrophota bacterium]
MRKLILLILLVCSSSLVYAKGMDRLMEFDLGKIPPHKTASYRHEFHEEIVNVTSLCECIKAHVYKKYDHSTEPIYVVSIEFEPSGYNGEVSQDVLLLDSKGNLITLRLKMFVE